MSRSLEDAYRMEAYYGLNRTEWEPGDDDPELRTRETFIESRDLFADEVMQAVYDKDYKQFDNIIFDLFHAVENGNDEDAAKIAYRMHTLIDRQIEALADPEEEEDDPFMGFKTWE